MEKKMSKVKLILMILALFMAQASHASVEDFLAQDPVVNAHNLTKLREQLAHANSVSGGGFDYMQRVQQAVRAAVQAKIPNELINGNVLNAITSSTKFGKFAIVGAVAGGLVFMETGTAQAYTIKTSAESVDEDLKGVLPSE